MGHHTDRRHLFIGLHATIPIFYWPRWSFRYAPELVPLLVVTNNPTDHRILDEDGVPITVQGPSKPVAGFGFSPIGLGGTGPADELRPRLRRWGPWWGVVHAPSARALLARVQFHLRVRRRPSLANRPQPDAASRYKFHHFSNAKTAPRNPGVDAEVFLIGFEQTFGRR